MTSPSLSPMAPDEPELLVVVTGVSGAGKSTAVNALEDLGFFCVDNLPTPVVLSTIDALAQAGVRRMALGIDVRVRGFLDDAARVLESLPQNASRRQEVVFLDAADEAILRRFSSTRRPHPLSTVDGRDGAARAVLDGIKIERELLSALRARATLVVDTTRLSVHELRQAIVRHFGPAGGKAPRLRVRIVSFGFKFGSPIDADIVLDVRFLKNPFFVPELSALPGTDPEIEKYVLASPKIGHFLEHVHGLLGFCIPRFEAEGRSYLTVAIGCTGGRHRSVVVAERVAAALRSELGLTMEVVHRDLERVNMSGPGADPDHGALPVRGESKP
jgi:RNase adapter protein RapZ